MKQVPGGEAPYISITTASGASNVCTVTVTIKDSAEETVPEPMILDIWLSDEADGAGFSAETPSGEIVAVTGTDVTAYTRTKVCWEIMTATNGIYTGSFTDTGVPTAGYYLCVQDPRTGMVSVSDKLDSDDFG